MLSGRFIHLPKHHARFVEHTGVFHFVVEVVALAGSLTNTCKHRVTAVKLGNVVNKLLYQHRFAHTRTTKQPHLATFGNGRN
jgi:hypothetical protein